MIKFIKNIQFLFMPSYWIMNLSYSNVWDKKLNELLDKYEFTDIDKFTAKLGNYEIWVANHPYNSFVPYDDLINGKYRASRLTILRARKKLISTGWLDRQRPNYKVAEYIKKHEGI